MFVKYNEMKPLLRDLLKGERGGAGPVFSCLLIPK
jgi:hypothetical protein